MTTVSQPRIEVSYSLQPKRPSSSMDFTGYESPQMKASITIYLEGNVLTFSEDDLYDIVTDKVEHKYTKLIEQFEHLEDVMVGDLRKDELPIISNLENYETVTRYKTVRKRVVKANLPEEAEPFRKRLDGLL